MTGSKDRENWSYLLCRTMQGQDTKHTGQHCEKERVVWGSEALW